MRLVKRQRTPAVTPAKRTGDGRGPARLIVTPSGRIIVSRGGK